MVMQLAVSLAALALLAPAVLATRQHRKVRVDTKLGELQGVVVQNGNDGEETTQFLGVPYAKSPLNHRRFRQPHPIEKWQRPLHANKMKPLCPHNASGTDFWMHPEVVNELKPSQEVAEDCLYLNIYVGKIPSSDGLMTGFSLPVMVFFHGGGFQVGGPGQYSLSRMARFGDMVVVGVQYRLNIFGFFNTGDKKVPGNFGLYDQLMALQFIRENIEMFGGDRNRITIFGYSAGASSVGFHVLSPQSKGYFEQAISMSGSALSPVIGTPERAARLTQEITRILGCEKVEDIIVECLQDKPTADIMEAMETAKSRTGLTYLPMVDGKFIPEDPVERAKKGEFNDVHYMLGVTSHEGYWFQKRRIPFDLSEGASMQEFEDALRGYFKDEAAFENNFDQIMEMLKAEYGHCNDAKNRSQGLIDAIGEYFFIAPTYRFAELHARARANRQKTYFYEFARRPQWKPLHAAYQIPEFVQASHYADIDYIFGNVKHLISQADGEERQLSLEMFNMWKNFAKNGDPNQGSGTSSRVIWKPFTEAEPNYLRITLNMNETNQMRDFRPRRMTFWNQYMPFLLKSPVCSKSSDYCRPAAAKALNFEVLTYCLAGVAIVLLIMMLAFALKVAFPGCCPDVDDVPNGTATLVKATPNGEREKLSQTSKDIDNISESDL